MLTGDSAFGNPPQVLLLPAISTHKELTMLPSEHEFNAKILTTNSWPLFKHTQVHDQAYVLKIMPIPSFLTYDGFDQDINAIFLYKHFQGLHDQEHKYVQAALSFLWACLVQRQKNDPSTFVEDKLFLNKPHPMARTWAAQQFKMLYPSLAQDPNQHQPQEATALPNAQLLQSLLVVLNHKPLDTSQPQEAAGLTEPNFDDLFGMCKEETDLHLKLCSLKPGNQSSLPDYLKCLLGKQVSDSIKNQILTSHI